MTIHFGIPEPLQQRVLGSGILAISISKEHKSALDNTLNEILKSIFKTTVMKEI
jgi:hypothetical protein